jgi:nucleotide-binding universal stress UspA family protein
MLERVKVPIDFTPESEHAIPFAVMLAGKAQATVELVTVVEPIDREGADLGLKHLAQDAGRTVEWRVLETGGPPEAALLTELHRGGPSLWCIGSHARGALGELLLGSLSEDVVRQAHEPLLIIGPQAVDPSPGNVLLVALDGTARGEAILPAAAELARDLGMALRLVQVVQPDLATLPSDASDTGYLSGVAERISAPADVDVDVLYHADAAHGLADYVLGQPDVGIVALSTRGLSRGARLLHPSTAFEVARRVRVPTLILHALEPPG